MVEWARFEPRRTLEVLTVAGVDFVVIGGYAAVLHGSPRVTHDVDVCYATDEANLRAIARVLRELNARPAGVEENVPFALDERMLARTELLMLETDAGRLDLASAPAGSPGYGRLRANAARYDIGGFLIMVAELDDLLVMKAAAGRPKDLADIAMLETIARLRKRLAP